MKRFVIIISCVLCALALLVGLYYAGHLYLTPASQNTPAYTVRTRDGHIEHADADGWQELTLRGVDLGSSQPGAWSTDYAIDKETYLRWFGQMAQMGANTVRVYAVQSPAFYRALKEYNTQAQSPLYLLQGIWVDDYAQNSHVDAYDRSFQQALIDDCKAAVDVIHGKRLIIQNDAGSGSGLFFTDVSKWVLGYIIGGEWIDVTVAYTDEKYPDSDGFAGSYLQTAPQATAFETMLAQTGDALIAYETDRYRQQRLVSFANTRTTDPFVYPQDVTEFFRKCATIDAEHILPTEALHTGLFASYSVYAYDLDYLSLMAPATWPELVDAPVDLAACDGTQGVTDTYLAYLKLLRAHHTMPVVATEFGVSTGRALAQSNTATSLRQGHLSEQEQAQALLENWQAIVQADFAGGCVFSWQDEWHKRTWNTMFAVDLSRSPYWSDAQSSDQHFGLLAFDPGEEAVCVVDGDASEWSDADVIVRRDDGGHVSLRYDERYLYLLIEQSGYEFGAQTLYVPIDTTQKTGAHSCPAYDLCFDRGVDFILRFHTKDDSVLLVQDRYHAIHANFEAEITGRDAYLNPPAKDSTNFEVVQLAVKDTAGQFVNVPATLDTYETGALRCGTADPAAENYDSLTDFAANGEIIELRLPWALLNFADPSRRQIHDDYYDGNYGVAFQTLKKLYVGLGCAGESIALDPVSLKGWGNDVTWHERLKPGYFALQACWKDGADA